MNARKKRSATAPLFELKPGDWVLVGSTAASLPGDWWLAKVLLIDGDEVATAHTTPNVGYTYRQFHHRDSIRAVGTLDELRAIQDAARDEVKILAEKVREAETALHHAREVVWARVRAMAQDNIKINPNMPPPAEPSRFMLEEATAVQ